MFKEELINKIEVKPVQTVQGEYNKDNLKCYSMFPNGPYFNLFLCAKKRSGKTSTIKTIIDKCINKDTTIWLFCSTYEIDSTYIEIIKNLKDKGITVNCFDTITLLDEIIDELQKPDVVEEEKETKEKKVEELVRFSSNIEEKKRVKPYKPKKVAPKHIFIFDDLSTLLKNPAVSRLLKIHRHFKSSVIISSQYLHDIEKQSILQLDYMGLFKSFSYEKIEYIHKLLDLSIDIEDFWNLYHQATEKPYSFLYIDIRHEQFRINFNKKLII